MLTEYVELDRSVDPDFGRAAVPMAEGPYAADVEWAWMDDAYAMANWWTVQFRDLKIGIPDFTIHWADVWEEVWDKYQNDKNRWAQSRKSPDATFALGYGFADFCYSYAETWIDEARDDIDFLLDFYDVDHYDEETMKLCRALREFIWAPLQDPPEDFPKPYIDLDWN